MAQVKDFEYDVTDVESSGGQTGVRAPAPAVYDGVIRYAEPAEAKNTNNTGIRIGVDVGSEYDWVFENVWFSEAALWKLKELLTALGLPMKGKLKPSMLLERKVRVKLNSGTEEYGPEIKRWMKPLDADDAPDAPDTPDTPDTPDSPDEPEAQPSGGSYPNGYEPCREDPDGEVGSYDDWPDEDLKGEFDDRGLTVDGRRTKAKTIEALRADDAAAAGGGSGSSGEDDYDSWSDEDLAEQVQKREITIPGGRGNKRQKMIDALREDDEQAAF